MVKNIKNIFLGIVSIIVFGIILYLLFLFFIAANKFIQALNPNIIVALIAGMVTVLGYFITRHLDRKKNIEQQIREQKLPVYEDFVGFVFKLLLATKNKEEIPQNELENFFVNFNKKSIVWLSDKSLKAYVEWRKYIVAFSENENRDMNSTIEQLRLLENMLYEFRKDIGHENKNLISGDLLSLFINDMYKYQTNAKLD